MDTSGLMLAAKSDEAQKAFQDLIRLRVLDRRYTVGISYVAHDSGTIESGHCFAQRETAPQNDCIRRAWCTRSHYHLQNASEL